MLTGWGKKKLKILWIYETIWLLHFTSIKYPGIPENIEFDHKASSLLLFLNSIDSLAEYFHCSISCCFNSLFSKKIGLKIYIVRDIKSEIENICLIKVLRIQVNLLVYFMIMHGQKNQDKENIQVHMFYIELHNLCLLYTSPRPRD